LIKRSLFALALAAALPVSAQAADGLSFTYVEADYLNTDVVDTDLNGFGLKGNVAFHENWYATASYSQTSKGDVDLGYAYPADLDFEQSTLGVGFHTAIANNVHFLAELAWVRYEFQTDVPQLGSATAGYEGGRATAGIRAMLGDRFELEGKAHYADLDEIDGSFGAEVNGMFHINNTWGVGAGYARQDLDSGNDADQWHVGVRASF
jgi:hypothetical protein